MDYSPGNNQGKDRKTILNEFESALKKDEKSEITIAKYRRDLGAFLTWQGDESLSKDTVCRWKQTLVERGYQVRSINSMLASLNAWLRIIGREDCRTKNLKLQQQIYRPEEKELNRTDYFRLLEAAREKPRLWLMLQTICSTGIRVSELSYFTVEGVNQGVIIVRCKAKCRQILVPREIQKSLLQYADSCGYTTGPVFRTRYGNPLNRSNVWADMKRLCEKAGVPSSKVYPHNLRKLFACSYYDRKKDIAALADVLGHSSINTTRIYLMSTGREHREELEAVAHDLCEDELFRENS